MFVNIKKEVKVTNPNVILASTALVLLSSVVKCKTSSTKTPVEEVPLER